MAFAENQIRRLAGKLHEKHIKTRENRGMKLSYIEGWHAIDEANRVFGFDGWDRETAATECVFQDGRASPKTCAYTVRVRIRVRAGETVICRDGSGVGHGSAPTLGEAHESALKEAETDATKRALTTFGNLFGLALYDREQAGVRRAPKAKDACSMNGASGQRVEAESEPGIFAATHERAGSAPWTLVGADGLPHGTYETPQAVCVALKDAIAAAGDLTGLDSLWHRQGPVLARLRTEHPELRTPKGTPYADVLAKHYERRATALNLMPATVSEETALPAPALPIDKSVLMLGTPKRLRDRDHLRFVSARPCLVCGRTGAQAHHLRFCQPRAMGLKVSDEWTVPLCFTHHRALHDVGNEEAWWAEKGVDAKAEALGLWAGKPWLG
ncbi:MAG TPA: Rad52/Rad22 family DNA repair protein, partial [Caulobacteraceae bacterium]